MNQRLAQLLRRAPDAKSLEAGRRLFFSRRWRLLGGDGHWLWGEFETGGRKPVESAVGLEKAKFFCTCRARNRPCAHNLALILLLKNDPDRLTVGQPPSWVRSAQHQAERPRKTAPKDAAAATARQDDRMELMSSGIDELELRLLDVARRGLADTLGRGPDFWLSLAGRLTDAKLGGLGSRVKRLARLGPDADTATYARTLGDLYIFIRAWRQVEALPQERKNELLQVAGRTVRRDELLARPGLDDHWLVMGTVQGKEDKLTYRRTWLRGERSRRFILLLDFVFGERQPFERSWPLAASFTGKAYFYPGSYPQRAYFPEPRVGGKPYEGLNGYDLFADLAENYRKALATAPWLSYYPAYLPHVWPRIDAGGARWLVDTEGNGLRVAAESEGWYRLLAVSGGKAISVFAEFDGYRIWPLSVFDGGVLRELS